MCDRGWRCVKQDLVVCVFFFEAVIFCTFGNVSRVGPVNAWRGAPVRHASGSSLRAGRVGSQIYVLVLFFFLLLRCVLCMLKAVQMLVN